jgi:uncharacterized repeat protein (TIGR03803 family)
MGYRCPVNIFHSQVRLSLNRICLIAILAVASIPLTTPALAQNYRVGYLFTSTDGFWPNGSLIRDASNNLYGTLQFGGDNGAGTVFRLNTAGLTTLHSFNGTDGLAPAGGLTRDPAGNLYGTTTQGGPYGAGTLFELHANGVLVVLHTFKGGGYLDGGIPLGTLLRDAAGNLYGTTYNGGKYNLGTLFKVDLNGVETILYSFGRTTGDGANPGAGLICDSDGTFYGTTSIGGNGSCGGGLGCGVVFKFDRKRGLTALYQFRGGADGAQPGAPLVRDAEGNLYGTTEGDIGYGGKDSATVFKVDVNGQETVLHTFTGEDGDTPRGGLLLDRFGNLYGTTSEGGAYGLGTVFKLDTQGSETILHSFNGRDGLSPFGELLQDALGSFFGTTVGGGRNYGVIFELAPDGAMALRSGRAEVEGESNENQ